MRCSTGDIVLLRDEDGRLAAEEIPRLWWAMNNPEQQDPDGQTAPHGNIEGCIKPPDLVAHKGFRMFLRRSVEPAGRPAAGEMERSDSGGRASSRPKRPNYLARLRDFALGN
jgi:hypothetical protein